MATKRVEIDDPQSVLNKAADDEPIFVLRSTDKLAKPLVNMWIMLADQLKPVGVTDEKVDSAIRTRDQMDSWQGVNIRKVGLPD